MRRGLVAGAALASAACALAFPALAPGQTPERALIAYEVSVSEGHSEIYLVRSDGSERRRLTGSPPSLSRRPPNFDPAWAPDGMRLAYVRGPASERGTTQIRVRDLATGAEQVLAGGTGGFDPAWSPDGARIAFLGQNAVRQEPLEASLYVMNADGSGVTKLVDGVQEPEWTPDGRRIVFTRFGRETSGIYVVNADGTGVALLARDGASPSFAPDGTRIAFTSARDRNGETCFEECSPNAELYVMNADGTAQTRLTNTTAEEETPRWSPDGMRIAFDSDRNSPESSEGGGGELYSINADGSCMTWLTNGSAESRNPTWQPGAGRATDPGPACGAAPRSPTFDVDAGPLEQFKRFRVYWLGQRHGNLLLSALLGVGPIYGDCASYSPGDCANSIQIQNRSTCERNPFTFGGPLGGGETGRGGIGDVFPLPTRRFRYRGAILVFYPSAGGWDLYTGKTTVTIFAGHDRPRDVKALVRSLRLPRADEPSGRPLPPPVFPDVLWRKLDRFTAADERLGSVAAVGHELGVTPRAVRDKLALARMLRRFGPRRELHCPRDLHPPRR